MYSKDIASNTDCFAAGFDITVSCKYTYTYTYKLYIYTIYIFTYMHIYRDIWDHPYLRLDSQAKPKPMRWLELARCHTFATADVIIPTHDNATIDAAPSLPWLPLQV